MQTELSMKENPEVQRIVNDKAVLDRTTLSPHTVVENNVASVVKGYLVERGDVLTGRSVC